MCAYRGRDAREVESGHERLGGDIPGEAERPTNVLLVDHAVDERDSAPECGGESSGLQAAIQ